RSDPLECCQSVGLAVIGDLRFGRGAPRRDVSGLFLFGHALPLRSTADPGHRSARCEHSWPGRRDGLTRETCELHSPIACRRRRSYRATSPPTLAPTTSEKRKWIPSQTRASMTSWVICDQRSYVCV